MAYQTGINFKANNNRSLIKPDNNYDFALIKAVEQNNPIYFTNIFLGVTKVSLDKDEKPEPFRDLLDKNGKSLIMIAVENAITDPEYIEGILTTLINFEYQTNILDATNRTPLHVAAAAGNKVIVEKLLATGMLNIDKHIPDSGINYGSALFAAIKKVHLKIAELLRTKGANINIQLFPIEALIKNGDIKALNYFIKLSENNTSVISNKTPIIKSSDFDKFSNNFKENFWVNNTLKIAAQSEQPIVFEFLIEQFITNHHTLVLKSAIYHEQKVRSMIFDCLQKDENLLKILLQKGEVVELLFEAFVNDKNTPSNKLETILNYDPKLLGEENSKKFTLVITNLAKKFIQKYSNKEFDDKSKIEVLIKAMVSNTAKLGNTSEFDNLLSIESNEFSKSIKKQILEYSSLELAVKHNNLSIIDAIVQHILVHSDVKAVKDLLHLATSNMKKNVFNKKIMQENNFETFSKYFKQKLESGELLTNILQSVRENNLEVVKALVKLGTPIEAKHFELAAKDLKTFICLSKNATAGIVTSEVINTAKQKYISSIKPQFEKCKDIKTVSDFSNYVIELAQYFDPNTTDTYGTLEKQVQYEDIAFSDLLGKESPY